MRHSGRSKAFSLERTYVHTLPFGPFVGVNAPMDEEQIFAVGALFRSHFRKTEIGRYLGLHVSYKDLHGMERSGRWADHYPPLDRIPTFIDAAIVNGMKAVIHYNTKRDDLCDELESLERLWRRIPDGWQLNVKWPAPRELERYLERDHRRAETRFIVQVGAKAYAEAGNDPARLAERLKDYRDLASHCLFDLSGGVGKLFDPEVAVPALEAIETALPGRVAVAGGLGPDTVRLLEPLVRRFPGLSWDAQGRLRDEKDHLDLSKVDGFLAASATVRAKAAGR